MKPEIIENNVILKLSASFALLIIPYCERLQEQRKFVIANQLIKSGTSIGANIWESQNAESKVDFIHKLKIAAKEANETEYWLYLCAHSEGFDNCDFLIEKLNEINKVLTKIIATTKTNLAKQPN